MTTYYTYIDTPIKPIRIASNGTELTEVYMTDQTYGLEAAPEDWLEADDLPVFITTREQLNAYFKEN